MEQEECWRVQEQEVGPGHWSHEMWERVLGDEIREAAKGPGHVQPSIP